MSCPNQNSLGGCKLHNMQCGYPKCETTAVDPVKPDHVVINGMHFSHSEILKWREEQVTRLDQHDDDKAIDVFAQAMKNKMAIMRDKGAGGWDNKSVCTGKYLAKCLVHSVGKGDPVDIANFAMMLFNRNVPDFIVEEEIASGTKCSCYRDEWNRLVTCKPCYVRSFE